MYQLFPSVQRRTAPKLLLTNEVRAPVTWTSASVALDPSTALKELPLVFTTPASPEIENPRTVFASPPHTRPSDAVPQSAWFGRTNVSEPIGELTGVVVVVVVGALVVVEDDVVVVDDEVVVVGAEVVVVVGAVVVVVVDPPGISALKDAIAALPDCVSTLNPQRPAFKLASLTASIQVPGSGREVGQTLAERVEPTTWKCME